MTTSSSQQSSHYGSQHQLDTAVGDGGGDHAQAPRKPSKSTLASIQSTSTSDDASNSTHTAMGEPMKDGVQLKKIFIPNAVAMGYQIEQPLRSANSTASGSSTEDLKELEKGVVASTLIQHEIGAHENIGSELTLVSRMVQTPPSSQDMNLKSYEQRSEQVMPLPQKRATPLWRRLRHRLLAVYQRLFFIVLLGNTAGFITVLVLNRNSRPFGPSLGNIASAVAANVTGAILIRQEYFVNALYEVCCWTPLWMPFRLRRVIAKLYHFGGVHSGCAVSAVAWFVLYTAFVTKQHADGDFGATAIEIATLSITYSLLVLFLSITIFAVPSFRIVSHNTFEAIHRFGGWLAVALFWVLMLLSNHAQSELSGSPSLGMLIVEAPAFWLLLAVTSSIIIPWLRLRHVPVYAEQLSRHAIRLHFTYIKKIGPVVGIRIATSPLKEWHAFAAIPSPDGSSFSIIVSDAGDWTKQQIINPAARYWVRGIPITGVLRMASVFRRVVVVTTGSGIGPVLSMVFSSSRMAATRILWSTPNPLQTYGQGIVDAVVSVDKDAVIWNTRERGRPHMVALAYQLFKESEAEAVFVISNPPLTSKLVYAMEARGVPAYGPIWDS